jgi:DNA-binding MarR family transcriptional regulator
MGGYLKRTTDPFDRRAKIIKFTDPGWATVNLALSALAELEAEITGRLGEPAVRQLRSTLLRILDRPAYTRREGSSGPSA